MADSVFEVAPVAGPGQVLLSGAVDGTNQAFVTTRTMDTTKSIKVYRNGLLKLAALEDGYNVVDSNTIVFNEPPEAVDTVEVEYVPLSPISQLPVGIPQGGAASIVAPAPGMATLPYAMQPTGGSITLGRQRHHHRRNDREEREMGHATLPNGGVPLQPGLPVTVDVTGRLLIADAASSSTAQLVGVTQIGAQPYAPYVHVITEGSTAFGVLQNATPMTRYFLAVGGGISSSPPTAPGSAVVEVGIAVNTTDMLVQVRFLGTRSAP